MLTQEFLKEAIEYNSDTGGFVWKVSPGKRRKAGDVAGAIHNECYIVIRLQGKLYKAHRLAWFYIHGLWPDQIDHKNGIRSDNRINNLRNVTNNKHNQRKPNANNLCGYLGVSFDKQTNKYRAHIRVNGQLKSLGYFTNPEAAHAAYLKAKRELHEFCTI